MLMMTMPIIDAQNFEEQQLYDENFEQETVGVVPVGVGSFDGFSGQRVIVETQQAQYGNNTKFLLLKDNFSRKGTRYCNWSFNESYQSDERLVLSFQAYFTDKMAFRSIQIYDANGVRLTNLNFSADGVIAVDTNTYTGEIGQYEAGCWYDLMFDVSFKTGTYNFWINDVETASRCPLDTNENSMVGTNIARLKFGLTEQCGIALDNITIKSIEEVKEIPDWRKENFSDFMNEDFEYTADGSLPNRFGGWDGWQNNDMSITSKADFAGNQSRFAVISEHTGNGALHHANYKLVSSGVVSGTAMLEYDICFPKQTGPRFVQLYSSNNKRISCLGYMADGSVMLDTAVIRETIADYRLDTWYNYKFVMYFDAAEPYYNIYIDDVPIESSQGYNIPFDTASGGFGVDLKRIKLGVVGEDGIYLDNVQTKRKEVILPDPLENCRLERSCFDDFESYTVGKQPPHRRIPTETEPDQTLQTVEDYETWMWKIEDENNWTFRVAQDSENGIGENYGKMVCSKKYADPTDNQQRDSYLQFFDQEYGIISVSFKILLKQTDATSYVFLDNETSYYGARLDISNGVFSVYNGTTSVTACTYEADRWYDIRMDVNLENRTANYLIDGKVILSGVKLCFDTEFSHVSRVRTAFYRYGNPGEMYFDDFRVDFLLPPNEAADIEITGPNQIAIPMTGEKIYAYRAGVLNPDDRLNTEDTAVWSADMLPDGVALDENGDLTVKAGVTADKITLKTTAISNPNVTKSIEVSLLSESIDNVEITGPGYIHSVNGNAAEKTFHAKVYDQFGREASIGGVRWSISSGEREGIAINDDGVVTVDGNTVLPAKFVLRAVSKANGNIYAEKSITVNKVVYNADDESRFDEVVTQAENILKYGHSRVNPTPLFADGINVYSKEFAQWRMSDEIDEAEGQVVSFSNLSNRQNMLRLFDGLSQITGDNKYVDAAKDEISYVLKHYSDPVSGLPYWGDHRMVDIDNLKMYGDKSIRMYHEFKSNCLHWDLFFEAEPERTEEIIKGVWNSHIRDWRNLDYNRHGHYGLKTPQNIWQQRFIEPEEIPYFSVNLAFSSTGTDLFHAAAKLYQHTGDEAAWLWAERLDDLFTKARYPGTNLGVNHYSHVGKVSYSDYPYKTSSYFGDRAMRQFGKEFGDAALEPYALWGGMTKQIYGKTPINWLNVCKILPEKTKNILNNAEVGMESFLEYAYIPEKNLLKPMWADGTDLSNYTFKEYGYYGEAGTVLKQYKPFDEMFLSYMLLYNLTGDNRTWQFIRNMGKTAGLGDLGTAGGENIDVNFNASCSNALYLFTLLELYNAYPNPNYLELAKQIGNNIANEKFYNGFFTEGQNYKYANFNSPYPYALLALDAAIKGRYEEVPTYEASLDTLHFLWLHEDGYSERTYTTDLLWPKTFENVQIKQISLPDNVYLSEGETMNIEPVITPSDAIGNIIYESSNPSIASVDADGVVRGNSPGSVLITAFVEKTECEEQMRVTVGHQNGGNSE